MRRRKWWTTIGLIFTLLLGLSWCGLRQLAYYVSATRYSHAPLAPGNAETPTLRSMQWREHSEVTEAVLKHWANHPLGNWKSEGKIAAPRALLGRFLMQQDLDAANAYLVKQKPWGNAGSTWEGHPDGDYDFTMAGLIPILFLFGDQPEVLYPQTRKHLLT